MNVFKLVTVFDEYTHNDAGLFATEELAKQEASRRAGEELAWFESYQRLTGLREWSCSGHFERDAVHEYIVEEVPVHHTIGPFGEEEE